MAKPGDYDIYCDKILKGKMKVEKIYESDNVLAFYHTNPLFEFHAVIIPKEHIHDMRDLEDKHKELMWEIVKVAQDILETIDVERIGAQFRTGFGKSQSTPHLHFHVIGGKKIRE
ncbi:HIT domain-containing protein [Candidatus Dojkabacteria bacterium]|nr:HIT domain-containing protein [Candidatus Dojkabacteria bacterium]